MGGCNGPARSEACPNPNGPDLDIGNSPILKTLPNGKRALIVAPSRGTSSRWIRITKAPCSIAFCRPLGKPSPWVADGAAESSGAAPRTIRMLLRSRRGSGTGRAARSNTGEKAGRSHRRRADPLVLAHRRYIPGVVFEGASNGRLFCAFDDGRKIHLGFQHRAGSCNA
jgi:hypothetical protein